MKEQPTAVVYKEEFNEWKTHKGKYYAHYLIHNYEELGLTEESWIPPSFPENYKIEFLEERV